MKSILLNVVQLSENLLAGFRLMVPVPVSRRSFHFTGDQALLLLLLAAATALFTHYPFGAERIHLYPGVRVTLGARCFFITIVYYVISRFVSSPDSFVALATTLFSNAFAASVIFGFILWGAALIGARWWKTPGIGAYTIFAVIQIWFVVVLLRAVRLVYGVGWLRVALLSAPILLASYAVQRLVPPYFWYVAPTNQTAANDDPHVNTEWTYDVQPSLIHRELDGLAAGGSGGHLYFIGFAGTSTQDVFLKEVMAARKLFDDRFGTLHRSLLLANNPRTVTEFPVASVTNLKWALDGIARKMNRENDILFLYLTSHGSPHRLSVDFPELALNDLSDATLKRLLDTAGIKWRVLVVCACYSGSFINTLKNDHTLIITAAAADRTSFGCSNENDWTYFGDAYINTALRRDRSFIAAFEDARAQVARREESEKLTPSEPQIYVGAPSRKSCARLKSASQTHPRRCQRGCPVPVEAGWLVDRRRGLKRPTIVR